LKNKPKIGNFTKKHNRNAFAMKIKQNKKPSSKLDAKTGRQIEKTSPK